MTSLERRALLGDKKAQEECAKKGIALLCPRCKSKNISENSTGLLFGCMNCKLTFPTLGYRDDFEILLTWNTHIAPSIGLCKKCVNSSGWADNEANSHVEDGCIVSPNDFCNQFKSKGGD